MDGVRDRTIAVGAASTAGGCEAEFLTVPLASARLRVAPGDLTRIEGVFRVVCVRPGRSARGRVLATYLEESLNASVPSRIFEVVDAWFSGEGLGGHEAFLLAIGALAPDLVLIVGDAPKSREAKGAEESWRFDFPMMLTELLDARRPAVCLVQFGATSEGIDVEQPWPARTGHSVPTIEIDAAPHVAGRILADRLVAAGLVGAGESGEGSGLSAFHAWLGEAGERGIKEAESLARVWRLVDQKLRAARTADKDTRGQLERLCQDVAGRLAVLNAARRLQALDEHRRRLRYETPERFEGPAAHLGGVLALLGESRRPEGRTVIGSEAEGREEGRASGAGAGITAALEQVKACRCRVDAVAQRLPSTPPGRGSRLAAGTLVARIQEMLRAEAPLVAELRRQAELVGALGERFVDEVRSGLDETQADALMGAYDQLVRQLICLERDYGFAAVERALNALSGRGSQADAFPRLSAVLTLTGPGARAGVKVTAVGLVPSFDPYDQESEVTPGIRPIRLEVLLPAFFLGRVELEVDDSLRLESLELCPRGGPVRCYRQSDLARCPDRGLSTGTLFLGA